MEMKDRFVALDPNETFVLTDEMQAKLMEGFRDIEEGRVEDAFAFIRRMEKKYLGETR